MPTTTTKDADGNVTAIEAKPCTYTLSFSHKVPKHGGYGSGEEASLFAQIDLIGDESLEQIETKVRGTYAFIKSIVLSELGVLYGVDEVTGIIQSVDQAATQAGSKTAGKPRAYAGKGGNGSGDSKVERSKETLIQELKDNPDKFFDNREDISSGKVNAKSPHFKRKGTGEGVWLSDLSFEDRAVYEPA